MQLVHLVGRLPSRLVHTVVHVRIVFIERNALVLLLVLVLRRKRNLGGDRRHIVHIQTEVDLIDWRPFVLVGSVRTADFSVSIPVAANAGRPPTPEVFGPFSPRLLGHLRQSRLDRTAPVIQRLNDRTTAGPVIVHRRFFNSAGC